VWLAVHSPAVCDAMLDALESDAGDDGADAKREPGPYCIECGADVGIFLRFGLDWRHYRGDGSTVSQIELFDPGHAGDRLAPAPRYHPAITRRELRGSHVRALVVPCDRAGRGAEG
jgi:hypothetical protein